MYTALADFGNLHTGDDEYKENGFPLPPLLSDVEVGEILYKAEGLEKWVKDLKDYALAALLAGQEIPGWKAVEGRSKRAWDDMDQAFAALKAAGIEEAMLYHQEPYTLAQLEKGIGKKKFTELVGDHVTTPPGKPALAPETDKREAITAKPTAEEDFKKIKEEEK